MGFSGPLPKDPAQRRRRNVEKRETLPSSARVEKAPPLPSSKRYLKATRDWYETWVASPQATRFTATDWQRLAMLAPLVDEYFREPTVKNFQEIRRSEEMLGATVGDRQRLRWDIEIADPADAEKPGLPAGQRGRWTGLRVVDGPNSSTG
jgi:hypothetical protein